MKTIIALTLASLALSGCGGGSSTSPPDNTAALAQAAIKAIADKTPEPAKYTGSFTAINNVSNGFVSGLGPAALAKGLAQTIVDNPAKWPDFYRLLISDAGLRITLYGESLHTVGAASGLPLYAPDTIFLATLRSDGLHVVQIN